MNSKNSTPKTNSSAPLAPAKPSSTKSSPTTGDAKPATAVAGAKSGAAKSGKWWSEGVQFQCQGSGKCCTSHGEYGFVFMNLEDRKRMAKVLKMTTRFFTAKYCDQTSGAYHLKEDPANTDCMFLEGKRCGVYEGRPSQCRTWPFWPEVMNAKVWKNEVLSFCPGVGKGPVISAEDIRRQLDQQAVAEEQLVAEARENKRRKF